VCIIWIIKCLILLMHGATMKLSVLECSIRYNKQHFPTPKSISPLISAIVTLCLDEFWSLWLGQSIVSE